MLILPVAIIALLTVFALLISRRTWYTYPILVAHAIGQRTVSSTLHPVGLDQVRAFQMRHGMLNHALDLGISRTLRGLLVATFARLAHS